LSATNRQKAEISFYTAKSIYVRGDLNGTISIWAARADSVISFWNTYFDVSEDTKLFGRDLSDSCWNYWNFGVNFVIYENKS